VTPGNTPPVASVIVPVMVASCANARTGIMRSGIRNSEGITRRRTAM
jgi:hypothetical protein